MFLHIERRSKRPILTAVLPESFCEKMLCLLFGQRQQDGGVLSK